MSSAALDIIERIKNSENLPTLPNIAVRVLELTNAENVRVEALARVIESDPAHAARLLRVVNSAVYGIPRKVSTIHQAIVVLGLRTVKLLVLSFALGSSMVEKRRAGFDDRAFWRRSISSAVAARLLAKAVFPRVADEAFVGGLLCDLGIVAAWNCIPQQYEPLLDAWAREKRPLDLLERERLGVSHAQLSRELLENWKLPATICAAVGAHHGEGIEQLSDSTGNLGRVLHAAALIAGVLCEETPVREIQEVKAHCKALLRIGDEALEGVLRDVAEQVRLTAEMLSVEVPAPLNYQQIAAAAEQLGQIAMQVEVERMNSLQREASAMIEVQRLESARDEATLTDSLTGIGNRGAFDAVLREKLNAARSSARPLGLILLDIDRFKQFNDQHGHQAGDQVMRMVATSLNDVVRNVGFVARYGGDEFAAIVPNQTSETLRTLAEEIRRTIENHPLTHQGHPLKVTASLGVAAAVPTGAVDAGAGLVELADQALYRAKRAGANRVEAGAAA